MKKIISILLTVLVSLTAVFAGLNVQAASTPAQVTEVKATVVIDRFAKTVKLKTTWKKQKGVSGYQLKAGLHEDEFYCNKTKTISGASKTSCNLKMEYAAGVNYDSVKVRAYKMQNGKKVYGKWSKLTDAKFKVINEVKNFKGEVVEQHHSALKLRITWDAVKGAKGYQLYYISLSGDTDTINVTQNSYTGWMGNVETVLIRWYKIVDGKKVYSDYSDETLYYYER